MAVAPAKPRPRRLRARRYRAMLLLAIVAVALTGVAVMLNVLGDRYSRRIDVTATGEQQLSQRTRATLASMEGPYKVVIATDLRGVDIRSKERVGDVLAEMAKASPGFSYTWVDTGSSSGINAYRKVVADLIEREEPLLREESASIDLAVAACVSMSTYLGDTLSPKLIDVRDALSGGTDAGRRLRTDVDNDAALARVASRDLADAAGKAQDALKSYLNDQPCPATDKAAAALAEAMTGGVQSLSQIARRLAQVQESEKGPAGDAAKAMAPEVAQRRDQMGVVLDSMRRLKRPDVLRIADLLRHGSAVLVIGPPSKGVSAIDLPALLPSSTILDSGELGKADLRRRAEELLSTTIGLLMTPTRPVVVIVHAEARAFLDKVPLIARLTERLRLRGIDVTEWACVQDTEPPKLATLNPDGSRPVVYVALGTDSTAKAPGEGMMTGLQRAAKLGTVVNQLVESGKNVMACLSPSISPSFGQTDPMSPVLTRFGLAADSGRPLIAVVPTPRGAKVVTDQMVIATDEAGAGTNPITGAVRGLPTALPWAISFNQRPGADKVRLNNVVLYSIPTSDTLWAESQWLGIWQAAPESLWSVANPPKYDEGRDGRWPEGRETPTKQRWIVATSVERFEVGLPTQRFIAVGSNRWFIDQVTQQQVLGPDGRPAIANPGNTELFEAAVFWLAGQDGLIAQSPSARTVAMIGAIDEQTLGRVQLILIAGLPLGVLLLGMLHRLLRG